MAEYVVESARMAGPWNPTAVSTRRRFTATMRRSGRCCSVSLPATSGDVLEAGSGTGQHVVDFARQIPEMTWWPSDLNDTSEKHRCMAGACGTAEYPPAAADRPFRPGVVSRRCVTTAAPAKLRAVFCADAIHIAPWRVAEGLFAGAGARALRADGQLFLYGPFKRGGKHTSISNAVFDTSLRERDAEWGVRDIAHLGEAGGQPWPGIDGNFRDACQQPDFAVRAFLIGLAANWVHLSPKGELNRTRGAGLTKMLMRA